MAIDRKSEVKVEKYPLAVEVKLKMLLDMVLTFSFSPLPLDVSFQMSAHFLHLWTLCQKSSPQIFDKWYVSRDIVENVKGGSFLGLIHS